MIVELAGFEPATFRLLQSYLTRPNRSLVRVSTQVWTILGVVVGAFLSLGAQWLLAHQQRAEERVRETRKIRREAYARFIGARHQALQAVTKFANSDPDGATAFAALREANLELQDCIGLIGIVAPKDTYNAAVQFADLTLKSWEGGNQKLNADRLNAASVAFMAHARRDIGVD